MWQQKGVDDVIIRVVVSMHSIRISLSASFQRLLYPSLLASTISLNFLLTLANLVSARAFLCENQLNFFCNKTKDTEMLLIKDTKYLKEHVPICDLEKKE